MPPSATAQVAYDGDGLRTGSMDVRDLAPALLAIGDLLQHSNRVLNDDRANLAVKVRSDFKTGSFSIEFELVQSLASQASMFFSGADLKSAKDIAELVGIVVGAPGLIGLLKLLKMLRGLKPKIGKTIETGLIQISFGGNNHADVRREVLQLAADPAVQKAAADVMKPLATPDVDTFEVRNGKKTLDTYTRSDLPSFSYPEPIVQELKGVDEDRTVALEIIKPSFEDTLSWVFSDGSGGRFSAIMQDANFLSRVKRREVSFYKGDILKLRVHSRSYISDGSLRTENKITQVLEVISLPGPVPLLPPVDFESKSISSQKKPPPKLKPKN